LVICGAIEYNVNHPAAYDQIVPILCTCCTHLSIPRSNLLVSLPLSASSIIRADRLERLSALPVVVNAFFTLLARSSNLPALTPLATHFTNVPSHGTSPTIQKPALISCSVPVNCLPLKSFPEIACQRSDNHQTIGIKPIHTSAQSFQFISSAFCMIAIAPTSHNPALHTPLAVLISFPLCFSIKCSAVGSDDC